MDLFGENKIKKIKEDSISSRKEIVKMHKKIRRDENCLNGLSSFPNANEMCSFVSKGMSDAGSFLYAFHELEGVIEEAVIATWTISKENVLILLDYLDNGLIKKLTILLNDGLLKTNSTKPIYAFMRLEFDKRKDKVSYSVCNSHAKIQMYRTSEKYATISGSGNWSRNPRIENYIVIGGKEAFEFNSNWIKEIVNA